MGVFGRNGLAVFFLLFLATSVAKSDESAKYSALYQDTVARELLNRDTGFASALEANEHQWVHQT